MTPKEKHLESSRRWKRNNAERVKAYQRDWEMAHKEHRRSYSTLPARREYRSEYQKTHRKRYLAHCRRRQAAKRYATPAWVNNNELVAIYEACPPGMQVDHIVPLQGKNVCGLHVPWNLQYLSPSDNQRKGNRI